MITIHATGKLRTKTRQQPIADPPASTGRLGSWYATDLGWRPRMALFVNEPTLLPVLVPLAPATTLGARFVEQLGVVLAAHGCPTEFIDHEVEEAAVQVWAKTVNRSLVGILVEFAFLADRHRQLRGTPDPIALSVKLAGTPCSPLYKTHTFPDRALAALAADSD